VVIAVPAEEVVEATLTVEAILAGPAVDLVTEASIAIGPGVIAGVDAIRPGS
jgi:hypothetical protein